MPTNEMINQWGPAVIVCLTIIVGLFYNNQRISDFKDAISKQFEDFKKYNEDSKKDLYRYLDSKFKSIEDRLDKLENPIKVK